MPPHRANGRGLADTYNGGIDVNDPICSPSDSHGSNPLSAEESDINWAKLLPAQKWVRGEYLLVELKFTVAGDRRVHKKHVFAPSLAEAASRFSAESGEARRLLSASEVRDEDLKKAGLLRRTPLRVVLSDLLHLFSKSSLTEARIRLEGAYLCLRHGVST